jgi:membrane protein implicated in regulation of membrane protease activity
MTNLYLFCAAVGVPLLLWFVFAGDGDGGDGFGDADGGDGNLGFLPLSTLASLMAFFGLGGLLFDITGAAGIVTFVLAVIVGVVAGTINTGALRWLRNNSSSSEVMDHELEGTIANVALPISTEHRGKIILTKAGAREQMTASPVDGSTIDSGERVVIVRVEGGVALVTPLGPDLELE